MRFTTSALVLAIGLPGGCRRAGRYAQSHRPQQSHDRHRSHRRAQHDCVGGPVIGDNEGGGRQLLVQSLGASRDWHRRSALRCCSASSIRGFVSAGGASANAIFPLLVGLSYSPRALALSPSIRPFVSVAAGPYIYTVNDATSLRRLALQLKRSLAAASAPARTGSPRATSTCQSRRTTTRLESSNGRTRLPKIRAASE